jgi:peptide/nickel transport system substrate-binding protein
VACRKAVEYAVDKVSVQTAEGGPIRGDIASTVLPPDIPGYQKADAYATPGDKGDVAKAKAQLKACGKSTVSTNITARSDRPQEIDAATAIIASLKKVGITASLKQYPSGKYFTDYAGAPKFTEQQNIGLLMMQWGADWPSGYGFLQQILNGKAISQSGNTNLSSYDNKDVNNTLAKAIATEDTNQRNALYTQIDKQAMDDAVIVPLAYFKVLLARPNATNLVSSAAWSGQYDYLNIGTSK